MSFVYEVNLEVQQECAQDFEDWLRPHIAEMLTFDGFLRADWYHRSDVSAGQTDAVTQWTIQYHLDHHSFFQQYIEENAERMRSDGIQQFAGKFTATRRLYELKRRIHPE